MSRAWVPTARGKCRADWLRAVRGEGQYPAHSLIAISGSGATALKPVSDPELDDGLAGDPQPAGFAVKRFDHP